MTDEPATNSAQAQADALRTFAAIHTNPADRDRINNDANRWAAGAHGEQATTTILNRYTHARPDRTALHDRLLDPAKAWNLDHLLITPVGVYLIDSKNRAGNVNAHNNTIGSWRSQDGARRFTSKTRELTKVNSMAEATQTRLARSGIRTHVQPVLCLTNKASAGMPPQRLQGVIVVGLNHLLEALDEDQYGDPDLHDVPALAAHVSSVFPSAASSHPAPQPTHPAYHPVATPQPAHGHGDPRFAPRGRWQPPPPAPVTRPSRKRTLNWAAWAVLLAFCWPVAVFVRPIRRDGSPAIGRGVLLAIVLLVVFLAACAALAPATPPPT